MYMYCIHIKLYHILEYDSRSINEPTHACCHLMVDLLNCVCLGVCACKSHLTAVCNMIFHSSSKLSHTRKNACVSLAEWHTPDSGLYTTVAISPHTS